MALLNEILQEKSCGKCVWWAPLAEVLAQVYREITPTKLSSGICNNDQSLECGKLTDRTHRCALHRKDW